MLAKVVWELNDQQLSALRAAADAVSGGYAGALFLSFL